MGELDRGRALDSLDKVWWSQYACGRIFKYDFVASHFHQHTQACVREHFCGQTHMLPSLCVDVNRCLTQANGVHTNMKAITIDLQHKAHYTVV